MIFLSASIPERERDQLYFKTADVVAIRDAVRALATIVIPKTRLIWGGHYAITPLIRYILEKMDSKISNHVTIYQSAYFSQEFPEDNDQFEDIRIIPAKNDKMKSVAFMREKMISENAFRAAIFIGGMDGVIDEYNLFRKHHPNALILPVASTGGAAENIFFESEKSYDPRLREDYAYMDLFRSLLQDVID
ncbi:hypothetical protein ASU31_25745 [Pedobacter ginsenosidimutans]|uniref:Uncharacterized protein n=1 Tax=Pedobacter ginsenosidimutans TaxID=687842 RepID=A0A0T5VHD1_9SPHI|nr:hypothetical protein [Pedobacter ginsenosidimutans]KRT13227.1 hypothetical protein ASU31_25745 [Pedobacter ginsenosidimutans]